MLIPAEATLKEVITRKSLPLTLAWSRLEGRPVSSNFDRALKAEVRDAMWMLTKQWQMGEFEGEDAGSPVTAKLSTLTAEIEKYQADNNLAQRFDNNVPFEAKVEQRPLPFSTFKQEISLDLRLIMGRRWMQLLKNEGLANATKAFFLKHYAFKKPDPKQASDAAICAHPEVWQQFAAVAGRMMDGAELYFDLKSHKLPHYYDHPDFPAAVDHSKLDNAEKIFKVWFDDLFYQPSDPVNNAWEPSQLEYQFAISATAGAEEKVMHAI